MVRINSSLPHGDLVELEDIRVWIDSQASIRSTAELKRLKTACQLAFDIHSESGRRETSGESTLRHALGVADILTRMRLDTDTLVAAILHDALTGDQVDPVFLEQRFGAGVAKMVIDMARIGDLARVRLTDDKQNDAEHNENLRRMLLSIADDIRVVLVVLAERLHEMRVLKNHPEEIRRREAKETQDIYAPLANRLGIWQIKWELEDLCLRYLEPENYNKIAKQLDGRRADREQFIADVISQLRDDFESVGVHAEISGRPKHIYSIWKKMSRKGVDIDQIFDLRAIRVLTESVADCYAALGVVHGLWRHIPGEFDDYIATPKANMYRSIHTAVIGPDDKTLEVQIRTRDMHEHAELGVAAHWRYKESGRQDADFDRRVVLMRSWLEAKDANADNRELIDSLKTGFEARQVYVLTPQGKVIELPKGATPIDFAYAVHTEIGHRCRGARVDGRIAPLTHTLRSGELVEVITCKEGGPSRDWLSPHSGYLKTNRAKNRVRHWFKLQDYDEHVSAGRTHLDREIHRLGVARPDLEKAARRLSFQKTSDLLAAIGRAEVSPVQVAGWGEHAASPEPAEEPRPRQVRSKRHHHKGAGEVIVEGVGDLMTHMGRCCKPVPYDRVIGFITRGRGVTVHRRDCSVVRGVREEDRQRLVDVVWAAQDEEVSYPVDLRVIAVDRKGLLRDISSIFTNEEVDVIGVRTQSHRKTDRATMRFTIEIADVRQLSKIIDKVAQLPDVEDVRRQV